MAGEKYFRPKVVSGGERVGRQTNLLFSLLTHQQSHLQGDIYTTRLRTTHDPRPPPDRPEVRSVGVSPGGLYPALASGRLFPLAGEMGQVPGPVGEFNDCSCS